MGISMVVLSRLKNKSMAILLIALCSGVIASWSAKQHIQQRIDAIESEARRPEVQRIVASYNLPPGTKLDSDNLSVRSFPATSVPSDSLTPSEYVNLVGKVLQFALQPGDMVLPAHVTNLKPDSFSSKLSSGRRAITMPVDSINSVAGLLQPGDLIDLYVSFEYQRRRITAPLMQGVQVLATGLSTIDDNYNLYSDNHGSYNTVTLDVAPEDAVKLVAARQSGTITSVLRNQADDTSSTKASRGDLATLLGVNAPPPPRATRKPSVIYGNTTIRSVPKLQTTSTGVSQPSGMFELPYMPELVRNWTSSQDVINAGFINSHAPVEVDDD